MGRSEFSIVAGQAAAARANRPAITVVMPFVGEWNEAVEAAVMLSNLDIGPGDELILVDNSGTVAGDDAETGALERSSGPDGPSSNSAEAFSRVRVVSATAERSPAHARNAGAAAGSGGWILFLDADCRPRPGLLEAYFVEPIEEVIGALAGEVVAFSEPARAGSASVGAARSSQAPTVTPLSAPGRPGRPPLAARYAAAKGFLSQRQHLAHPYRPRAAAANLLVRRAAFEQVGGFYEGLRAAEDTDFTWRLQQAGWGLEFRPEAWVEHRYRTSLIELRRQWRGYAAGRAWLGRRYDGFTPEPAVLRALGRVRLGRSVRRPARSHSTKLPRVSGHGPRAGGLPGAHRIERGKYLAIDALLALEELAGLALSNRPLAGERRPAQPGGAHVVFVADRFPIPGDPLIELPTSSGARVEAAYRPEMIVPEAHGLRIDYREDDGLAERVGASVHLLIVHPLRCVRDVLARRPGDVPLTALAPAVRRLQRDRNARVQPLGGGAPAIARRLQALGGRRAMTHVFTR